MFCPKYENENFFKINNTTDCIVAVSSKTKFIKKHDDDDLTKICTMETSENLVKFNGLR